MSDLSHPEPIDVRHLGRDRVICCWRYGDVLVDPGPESSLATLLEALGDDVPRALLLTHIHFDHAGAAGALVRRWPHLEVHVHARGAPHLVDPERLVSSAKRLYGADFDRFWGEVVPIPEANLKVLEGGESVHGCRVAYAPGHASHHVIYLHEESGMAFAGDVAGVRIPPCDRVIAPTPPPDIDIELWNSSLDTLAAWKPQSLGITHFGLVEDVPRQIAAVRERLAHEGELARTMDQEEFARTVTAELAEATDEATAASFLQASPPAQLWQGLDRYWRKRAEREAGSD